MTDLVQPAASPRIAWVDYAKGICIILMVMMFTAPGLESASGGAGWMNWLIAFAAPFGVPALFAMCGLFLAGSIKKPWRSYLDSKFVHLGYFYVLWMTVQFAVQSQGLVAEMGAEGALQHYFMSFIVPFGTLWFIPMLILFFVLARWVQIIPQLTVWLVAAGVAMMDVQSGMVVIDEAAARFVYFYSGFVMAPQILGFAKRAGELHPFVVLIAVYLWVIANGWMVINGFTSHPVASLALGFAGIGAVVAFSALMARARFLQTVRYCGRHWMVIYLAAFVFMTAAQMALSKTGIIADAGLISLIVTAAGVIGPVVLHRAVRKTPAKFLFERPAMLRLKVQPEPAAPVAA